MDLFTKPLILHQIYKYCLLSSTPVVWEIFQNQL